MSVAVGAAISPAVWKDSKEAAGQAPGGVTFAAVKHDVTAGPLHVMSADAVTTVTVARRQGTRQKQIGIDSMASVGVSSDIDMFLELKPCKPFLVKGMDGSVLEACLGGRLELHLDSNGRQSTVILENVYYHPSFSMTLLSLGCLTELGWSFHSDQDSTYIVTPENHKVSLCPDHHVSMLHCTATSGAKRQQQVYSHACRSRSSSCSWQPAAAQCCGHEPRG